MNVKLLFPALAGYEESFCRLCDFVMWKRRVVQMLLPETMRDHSHSATVESIPDQPSAAPPLPGNLAQADRKTPSSVAFASADFFD